MTKEHEADIHWFKKTYKYLTEDCGWTIAQVSKDVGMNYMTVKKFATCTKHDFPRMRASTIAVLQDFVKKHKSDVIAASMDEKEFIEMNQDIIEENGNKAEMEAPEVKPVTLGEADTWDLLRMLSKREGIRLDIQISMN